MQDLIDRFDLYGTKSLTDSEVISLLFDIEVNKIADFNMTELIKNPKLIAETMKLNKTKYRKLQVFIELHQRISRSKNMLKVRINSPKSIADVYMEEMRYLMKEHMKVVFLDTKNAIIEDKDISIGTVNASLVDPREIFKEALICGAVHLILLHNHPSGDPTPSRDDIEVTKRCAESGKLIGIDVIDHIVIGDGEFVSFKEKGLVFF